MDNDSVGVRGRAGNQLELPFDGSVILTTTRDEPLGETVSLQLNREGDSILVIDRLIMNALGHTNDSYSIVYGERLIELLRWIIQTLKTHSHPPNATPVPTFFPEADKWLRKMDEYLLNKDVRSK